MHSLHNSSCPYQKCSKGVNPCFDDEWDAEDDGEDDNADTDQDRGCETELFEGGLADDPVPVHRDGHDGQGGHEGGQTWHTLHNPAARY